MACGYWKAGTADREAVFHLTYRRPPFGGGYAIAGGIAPAIAYLRSLTFTADDLEFLATLPDPEGKPLFPAGFIDSLRDFRFTCTVDAVPEGSLVFAHEPILRVTGPIIQAQLVETALLTMVNFQTLIATKASRVAAAAKGAPFLEFGLRRAQGIDGGLSASRAAYLGGASATSNVLAGKLFGIPVKGTHAHSWVMFHGDELSSFREYAAALPGNCTFLVDTYDTLDGVRNAIIVGKELQKTGHTLQGIRLDSGDLAHLSIEARKLLDEAGFASARIVASNDLDENLINALHEQGAKIDTWGIGTKLVTAFDQAALGGVYKLGAVREASNGSAPGAWRDVIKLSEQPIKISNPGVLQVKRLRRGGELVGDVIYDREQGFAGPTLYDIEDPTRPQSTPPHDSAEDLLVTYLDNGELVRNPDDLETCRARAAAELAQLSPRTRRFLNPQPYPVGLDRHVNTRKQQLIKAARGDHA
ncbi:MAG: nicotinate phosphoribosyltransferase [Deltaproteobacteria bacterium]|nr:nicotinate phosphoribosyltransferase [Deltaproteobacteria bacterium]